MRYLIVLFVLLSQVVLAYTAEEQKLQKVSIQLHWKYEFEFAGFIAAKEKGFYKDAGLDVELREYEYGLDIEDEVLSGRANYGVYNSYTLIDFLNEKPLRLIASFFKRAALVLVTKPDIEEPRDLIGKKIMAGTKEDFRLNFQILFDKYNIDIDKLSLVAHTYNIDDFVSGKVDAMTAFVSDQPIKLDQAGVKYNIINPSDYGIYVLQEEMFTSQNEIDTHPKRVEAFKEATIKGWEYAFEHKAEIIDIIYKKYSKNMSKSFLEQEAVEIEKLILPYTYNIGSIDKNFLNRQLELFNEYYTFKNIKKIEDYIYEDTLKSETIKFSTKEEKYLDEHRIISVCTGHDLMPFDGYYDGVQIGVMSDIYKILSEKTGLNFKFIPSQTHQEYMEHIANKDCQVVSVTTVKKSKLNQNLLLSEPFIETNFTLISTLDKSFIQGVEQLKGKKLITQFQVFKEAVLEFYPYLDIEVEENKYVIIDKLMKEKVYAVVTLDEQADYFIDKYGYGNLKINGFLSKNYFIKGSIAVQEDEAILLSILQKGLNQISFFKIDKIMDSWRLTRYKKVIDYAIAWKVSAVVMIILLVMFYYQRKIRNFSRQLAKKVDEKTKELRELNESLEETVKNKMEELIKKDKLLTIQSKQAVMGEMISMIAHQWRQPLSTITLQISTLQIPKLKGEKIDEDYLYHSLDNISDKIIYLSNTIDDFQTYFRPDREANEITTYEIFEKIVTLVAARIQASDIVINIIKNDNLILKIYVNELVQVLLNLVNNAIDSFEGIDKEQKNVYLYAKQENERVQLFVQDNGCGIIEENVEHLFEPYFSTKGKNGTGLGLYMSQMIVQKQFNGDVKVRTSPNGTTFIIDIPQSLE